MSHSWKINCVLQKKNQSGSGGEILWESLFPAIINRHPSCPVWLTSLWQDSENVTLGAENHLGSVETPWHSLLCGVLQVWPLLSLSIHWPLSQSSHPPSWSYLSPLPLCTCHSLGKSASSHTHPGPPSPRNACSSFPWEGSPNLPGLDKVSFVFHWHAELSPGECSAQQR